MAFQSLRPLSSQKLSPRYSRIVEEFFLASITLGKSRNNSFPNFSISFSFTPLSRLNCKKFKTGEKTSPLFIIHCTYHKNQIPISEGSVVSCYQIPAVSGSDTPGRYNGPCDKKLPSPARLLVKLNYNQNIKPN